VPPREQVSSAASVRLLRDGGRSWAKARDLRTRLRPLAATPAIAEAITVRNALRR